MDMERGLASRCVFTFVSTGAVNSVFCSREDPLDVELHDDGRAQEAAVVPADRSPLDLTEEGIEQLEIKVGAYVDVGLEVDGRRDGRKAGCLGICRAVRSEVKAVRCVHCSSRATVVAERPGKESHDQVSASLASKSFGAISRGVGVCDGT